MIDLPPPTYEQTIEAIVQCEIPRENVRIRYQDYLQSDEVTITDLGSVTEQKLKCLKGAAHPFYILTIEDIAQRATFYEFSEREDRPEQKAAAMSWLRTKGMLDNLPVFDAGQKLEDFAVAVELACGLRAGSTLMVWDETSLTLRPDALSLATFEKSAGELECVTQMMAASDAHENGVRFVIIGNAAVPEKEKD